MATLAARGDASALPLSEDEQDGTHTPPPDGLFSAAVEDNEEGIGSGPAVEVAERLAKGPPTTTGRQNDDKEHKERGSDDEPTAKRAQGSASPSPHLRSFRLPRSGWSGRMSRDIPCGEVDFVAQFDAAQESGEGGEAAKSADESGSDEEL